MTHTIPESWAPRWNDGDFIECAQCRRKPGSPDLCNWCLYVRERKVKNPLLSCPFCNEPDYDAQGLKHHLQTYCHAYDTTENVY